MRELDSGRVWAVSADMVEVVVDDPGQSTPDFGTSVPDETEGEGMTTKIKTKEKPQEADTGPICVVPECDRPVYVRGLCEAHWADPKA
jgi:hypothetical protein